MSSLFALNLNPTLGWNSPYRMEASYRQQLAHLNFDSAGLARHRIRVLADDQELNPNILNLPSINRGAELDMRDVRRYRRAIEYTQSLGINQTQSENLAQQLVDLSNSPLDSIGEANEQKATLLFEQLKSHELEVIKNVGKHHTFIKTLLAVAGCIPVLSLFTGAFRLYGVYKLYHGYAPHSVYLETLLNNSNTSPEVAEEARYRLQSHNSRLIKESTLAVAEMCQLSVLLLGAHLVATTFDHVIAVAYNYQHPASESEVILEPI